MKQDLVELGLNSTKYECIWEILLILTVLARLNLCYSMTPGRNDTWTLCHCLTHCAVVPRLQYSRHAV